MTPGQWLNAEAKANRIKELENQVTARDRRLQNYEQLTHDQRKVITELEEKLECRPEIHEIREKLEEMLRRERLLSEDRLHHIKRRNDRIQYLTDQVNRLEKVLYPARTVVGIGSIDRDVKYVKYVKGNDEADTHRITQLPERCSFCGRPEEVGKTNKIVVYYGDEALRDRILKLLNEED